MSDNWKPIVRRLVVRASDYNDAGQLLVRDWDATPADIAVWLHAHPAEAVEIVAGLKVAGPWGDGGDHWYRAGLCIAGGNTMRAAVVMKRWDRGVVAVGWRWHLPYENDSNSGNVGLDELDAAKSAADAALRAAGWTLA